MRPDVLRALEASLGGPNAPGSTKAALSTSPQVARLVATMPFESIHYEGKDPEIALAVPYMLGMTRFDDHGTPDVSPIDPRVVATADGPVVSGSSHALSGIRRREFIGVAERWDDLAVSPDGRYVVERVGAGRVWEAATGRVVRRFADHAEQVAVWTEAGLTLQSDPVPAGATTPVRSPNGQYEAVVSPPHGETRGATRERPVAQGDALSAAGRRRRSGPGRPGARGADARRSAHARALAVPRS